VLGADQLDVGFVPGEECGETRNVLVDASLGVGA